MLTLYVFSLDTFSPGVLLPWFCKNQIEKKDLLWFKLQELGCQMMKFFVICYRILKWFKLVNLSNVLCIAIKTFTENPCLNHVKKSIQCTRKVKGFLPASLDLEGELGSRCVDQKFSKFSNNIWRDIDWKMIKWLIPIVWLQFMCCKINAL